MSHQLLRAGVKVIKKACLQAALPCTIPNMQNLMSKPQEDLQFLEVATGSRPCTAFVHGMLHEEVTWCLPLAWHSTDPTFTPCRSKGCCFNITSPLTDTWCPVWWWIHTLRVSINCFSLLLSKCVWNLHNMSQTKEQKTHWNWRVCHFVWPFFSWPYYQSALIHLPPAPYAFLLRFPHQYRTCRILRHAFGVLSVHGKTTRVHATCTTKSHHRKHHAA